MDGILTTRYDWQDVRGHPCETALLQARILRRRGWTGRPRPCSARCPVAGFPVSAMPAAGRIDAS